MGGSDSISGLRWFVDVPLHSFFSPRAKTPATGPRPSPPPVRPHPKPAQEGGKKKEHSLLLLTHGGERARGRDVSAVRGARGPSARRASGASLPSPPDKPCVPIPSVPAARARRCAGPRGGVVLSARRARLSGRQGRRPGRRVLPRQGGRPRLFLACFLEHGCGALAVVAPSNQMLNLPPFALCRCPSV
jgi:hypothetical protein